MTYRCPAQGCRKEADSPKSIAGHASSLTDSAHRGMGYADVMDYLEDSQSEEKGVLGRIKSFFGGESKNGNAQSVSQQPRKSPADELKDFQEAARAGDVREAAKAKLLAQALDNPQILQQMDKEIVLEMLQDDNKGSKEDPFMQDLERLKMVENAGIGSDTTKALTNMRKAQTYDKALSFGTKLMENPETMGRFIRGFISGDEGPGTDELWPTGNGYGGSEVDISSVKQQGFEARKNVRKKQQKAGSQNDTKTDEFENMIEADETEAVADGGDPESQEVTQHGN